MSRPGGTASPRDQQAAVLDKGGEQVEQLAEVAKVALYPHEEITGPHGRIGDSRLVDGELHPLDRAVAEVGCFRPESQLKRDEIVVWYSGAVMAVVGDREREQRPTRVENLVKPRHHLP